MTSPRTLPTAATPPPSATVATSPSATNPRTIARRPGLPGGRAVLGALLVVTAGVGTFTLGGRGDGAPSSRYPVLRRAIDPGEPVTADAVEWRPMELDPDVAARSFGDPAELQDAVALVPMVAGELLQVGDVAPVGAAPSPAQLTIPVPGDRTPPDLRRGERVVLLATYGSGDSATTVRAVPVATVLRYESERDGIGSSGESRLTIALDDPAALVAAAHAAQVAELTVVRTTTDGAGIPETFRRRDEQAPA